MPPKKQDPKAGRKPTIRKPRTTKPKPGQNPPATSNLLPAWQPGQSGNPGGRPKGLAKQVRDLIGADGLPLAEAMFEIASSKNEDTRDRMTAIQWLADRGWGKAPQQLQVTGDDGGPIQIESRGYTLGALIAFAAAEGIAPDAGYLDRPPQALPAPIDIRAADEPEG